MLVGIDRVRVVRNLTEAWQAAIARRDMRLVVVEGPTGIGKTAMVQALYEQVAMLQLRPGVLARDAARCRTTGDPETRSDDLGR